MFLHQTISPSAVLAVVDRRESTSRAVDNDDRKPGWKAGPSG
jgi:hypothetical protein